MQRQPRRNTVPELAVRAAVRRLGLHYRTHARLPGTPDLANKSNAWVILVHGCYWHQHSGCVRATVPLNNRDWWLDKFNGTRIRDDQKAAQLRDCGLRVLVIWQCETKTAAGLAGRLARWFESIGVHTAR